MPSYFAAIYNDEGGYSATFPDLPGCYTQGDTLDELDAMLRDALACFLEVMKEDNDPIPTSRNPQEIVKEIEENDDFDRFAFITLVSIPEKVKRVRVNISLPETDLALIDRAASKFSLDRSSFLAYAAKRVAKEGILES